MLTLRHIAGSRKSFYKNDLPGKICAVTCTLWSCHWTRRHLPIVDLVKRLSAIRKRPVSCTLRKRGSFPKQVFNLYLWPQPIEQAHRANEFISLDNLKRELKFMKTLLRK
ncbi:MAG: hypothetical protein R2788_25265 [Saprospiraceae bacterium]